MKKIFSLLFILFTGMSAIAQDIVINTDDVQFNPGEKATVTINMINATNYYSAGMIVTLPEGFSFVKAYYDDEDEKYVYVKGGDILSTKHYLIGSAFVSNLENKFRFVFADLYGFNIRQTPFVKDNGSLAEVTITCDANMPEGVYEGTLSDIDIGNLSSGKSGFEPYEVTFKITVGNPATSSITATDVTARAGKTFTLPLNLENTDEITEADFKLALPEGVTLESAKVTSRGNGHNVDYKLKAGKYNFEVFSEKGNAFSGTEGAFVELTLKADAGIAAGDYDIQVSDISLITADDKEVAVADFSVKLTIEEPTATITASSLAAKAGKSIVLPINLENDNEITEIDFKLTLPAEVTLDSAMVTDRGADQEVSYKLRSGGYKFEVTSPAGLPFSGTEGAALNITLKTDKTTAAGDYDIQVSEILLITKEGKEISVKDFTVTLTLAEFKEITIGDITALIDEYLEQ